MINSFQLLLLRYSSFIYPYKKDPKINFCFFYLLQCFFHPFAFWFVQLAVIFKPVLTHRKVVSVFGLCLKQSFSTKVNRNISFLYFLLLIFWFRVFLQLIHSPSWSHRVQGRMFSDCLPDLPWHVWFSPPTTYLVGLFLVLINTLGLVIGSIVFGSSILEGKFLTQKKGAVFK